MVVGLRFGGIMGEIATFGAPAAAELAARLREANWTIARSAVSGVGDDWDVDESDYEFMCECARPGCQANVLLPLVEYVGAQSKGYDVVVPCHEDPRDLVVRRADGYRLVARARSTLKGVSSQGRALVGNWTCDCGQDYRVAARGSRILLWPRNSGNGFRTEPVTERCVRGCAIDAFEVLRTLVGRARQTTASL
jgi:hypothetical protein